MLDIYNRFLVAPTMGKWVTGPNGDLVFDPLQPGLLPGLAVPDPEPVESKPGDYPIDVDRFGSGRLVLRVTPDAHRWAHLLARHCSLCLSDLVWQSLLRQAENSGFYQPLPARYPRDIRRRKH